MNHQSPGRSLRSRVLSTADINWRKMLFIQADDFKTWTAEAKQKLKTSVLENNFAQPFYVWEDTAAGDIYCLDGAHRVLIMLELASEGLDIPEKLPATFIHCESKTEAARLVLIYSSMYAKVTQAGLFDFMKTYDLDYQAMKMTTDLPGFDALDFESLYMNQDSGDTIIPKSLTEQFIVPPFSVLDTRQGYWQDRKRDWHKIFDSQETREDIELIAKSGQSPAIYELRNKMRKVLGREPEWDEIIDEAKKKDLHVYEGASIFDPVLCEICYKWFCPERGRILDPFAGGSVRGVVAGVLDFKYVGIDLRPEQIASNFKQWKALRPAGASNVAWLTGDSNKVLDELSQEPSVDFVFSCPPYFDLEKYSDDAADISNMSYDDFKTIYFSIIKKSVARLKENRFACFVVGDIRNKQGYYRNFIGDTIEAFFQAGAFLYNEIILVNVAGSLPVRIGRQFSGYRKVGKMHQNVMVFYKGDVKKIKEEFPAIHVVQHLEELNNQPNIALTVTQ